MIVYGDIAVDEAGYCEDSCLATLSACRKVGGTAVCSSSSTETLWWSLTQTLERIGSDAEPYIEIIANSCQSLAVTNTSCHSGGNLMWEVVLTVARINSSTMFPTASVTYDDLPEGYGTVCPNPLEARRNDIDADAEYITATACVQPCPTVVG